MLWQFFYINQQNLFHHGALDARPCLHELELRLSSEQYIKAIMGQNMETLEQNTPGSWLNGNNTKDPFPPNEVTQVVLQPKPFYILQTISSLLGITAIFENCLGNHFFANGIQLAFVIWPGELQAI